MIVKCLDKQVVSEALALIAVGGYGAGMSSILATDELHLTMGQTLLVPAALGLHLLLGLGVGRWWALGLCVLPLVWALAFAGSVPADPDIPDYEGMLVLVLMMALPLTVGLTALGVWLRQRVKDER